MLSIRLELYECRNSMALTSRKTVSNSQGYRLLSVFFLRVSLTQKHTCNLYLGNSNLSVVQKISRNTHIIAITEMFKITQAKYRKSSGLVFFSATTSDGSNNRAIFQLMLWCYIHVDVCSTLQTQYNADVGIHNIRPRYK